MHDELAREGVARFPEATQAYDRLPADRIHRGVDVRSPDAAALIRRLAPDVVVVLGGPVYPPEFIAAAPRVLNFHSGVSPLYNGSATIHFAFANEHLHLCGGTLMTMNAVVDHGAVLAHFLPAIEPDDTPASLFMKTARGATELYDRYLREVGAAPAPSVPQEAPLFYYRAVQWSLHQSLLTRRHVARRIARKYARPEQAIEYWREPDASGARELYDRTIARLIWRRES